MSADRAVAIRARSRFSLEALEESRAARAILGTLLSAAVIALIVAILAAFTGRFTNVVKMQAQLPGSGTAIQIGAPVEYRNVTVGKLASESQGPGGRIAAVLDLYPSKMKAVPKGVTAVVAPLSIFGNQYVDLVPPRDAATAPALAAGDFIPAATSVASTSLQHSTSEFYRLLSAIHPADLEVALTNIATALRGEGANLGEALDAASEYMDFLGPQLHTLVSDLRLLAPVSGEINASAPDLLETLGNLTTTSRTIKAEAPALNDLLSRGAGSTGQLATLLEETRQSLVTLANDSAPLLEDVSANPHDLYDTVKGLGEWAAAWAAAESHGPYLSVSSDLTVADINAAVDAALGYEPLANIKLGLGSAVNPPTYTSADCPEYPGEPNPYCGVGGSPAGVPPADPPGSGADFAPEGTGSSGSAQSAQQAPSASSGQSSPGGLPGAGGQAASAQAMSPEAAQQQAILDIAAALDGGRPPASPSAALIILEPIFASMSASGP